MTLAMKMEVNNQLHIDWGKEPRLDPGREKMEEKKKIPVKRWQHGSQEGQETQFWLSMTHWAALGTDSVPFSASITHKEEERLNKSAAPHNILGQHKSQLLETTAF